MTPYLADKVTSLKEQRFLLPNYHTWEEFEAIEALMKNVPALRITYLDGWLEFMTLGELHELIKKTIAILLELYFFEKDINFIPVGSATRRSPEKNVSFEPDESYYIGEKKEHPDLAIEVTILSGDIDKLEKYKRFQIKEVWFWENHNFSIYRLHENNYELISRSEFFPELDIDLLARCVEIPSILEARKLFLESSRQP
jgi:Uma2 family endonuclease